MAVTGKISGTKKRQQEKHVITIDVNWGLHVWLALSPHSKRVPALIPTRGFLCACSPVYAWVLSEYSGFLPPSKNMHVRLTGDSKTVPRSECERVCVVVCFCVAL